MLGSSRRNRKRSDYTRPGPVTMVKDFIEKRTTLKWRWAGDIRRRDDKIDK